MTTKPKFHQTFSSRLLSVADIFLPITRNIIRFPSRKNYNFVCSILLMCRNRDQRHVFPLLGIGNSSRSVNKSKERARLSIHVFKACRGLRVRVEIRPAKLGFSGLFYVWSKCPSCEKKTKFTPTLTLAKTPYSADFHSLCHEYIPCRKFLNFSRHKKYSGFKSLKYMVWNFNPCRRRLFRSKKGKFACLSWNHLSGDNEDMKKSRFNWWQSFDKQTGGIGQEV